MEDEQNKTGFDPAPRCAELPLNGQGIDKFALKGTAVLGVQLDGGFQTTFVIQALQFLGADAEAHRIVFNTNIHDGWFSFNSVTVTCAL